MRYAVRLSGNGQGGFIARFPDVPEAVTEGADRSEALANAAEALEVALLLRMRDGEDLPEPKSAGRTMIGVSAPAAAKLGFYMVFRQSQLSRSELARRLGKDEAEVRRMLDPDHSTKLASLDAAMRVMGKRLVIDVGKAA